MQDQTCYPPAFNIISQILANLLSNRKMLIVLVSLRSESDKLCMRIDICSVMSRNSGQSSISGSLPLKYRGVATIIPADACSEFCVLRLEGSRTRIIQERYQYCSTSRVMKRIYLPCENKPYEQVEEYPITRIEI